MHYLLAIGLILSLTQVHPGTVLPTQQELTTIPEIDEPRINSDYDDDEEEEEDEPDCD